MTAERTRREANFFDQWAPFSAGLLPETYHFDEVNHVLAMEDLSGFTILTEALKAADEDQQVAIERIGRLLARAFLGTSLASLGPVEFSERLVESENPELAELMELVVFDQPWNTESLDHCHPELAGLVKELLEDGEFMIQIGELKYNFRTTHEGLIHGDLHTGSVMVEGDELRVFDAEFARYGPIAWDLGEFIAHLRIADVAHSIDGHGRVVAGRAELPSKFWRSFASELRRGWERRNDLTLSDKYLDRWLDHQRVMTARYAGAEIARRITGVGKAALVEVLPEDQMLEASRRLLDEARLLILEGKPTWR